MNATGRLPKELQTRVLASVLEFLVGAGASEASIRKSFESGLARSRKVRVAGRKKKTDGQYRKSGDVSAQLLRIWHRDVRLVSSRSLGPRSLSLQGGKNSLCKLVEKIDPDADAMLILRRMEHAGLIRQTKGGRYLPTANATVIPRLHPWVMEHAAKSVIRLVSTVFRNANREAGDPPLLERYSYVPDLSPEEGRQFAEFSRAQGQVYLDTIDDWLEQRRVPRVDARRRRAARGVPAGVHVITYLGEQSVSAVYTDKAVGECRAPGPKRATKKAQKKATSSPSMPA
jgi:hypothetical protein